MGRSKAFKARQAASKLGNLPIRSAPAIAQQAVAPRPKLIVAIDYGTTYSGVAYVTNNCKKLEDINLVTIWPGELATCYKTPSRIAYANENVNFGGAADDIVANKWGFEVGSNHKSYSWTKLLLDDRAKATKFDDPALANLTNIGFMCLPEKRDAAGVCEDFLKQVYEYVTGKIKTQISASTFDLTPMECWITLPAIWSEAAKDATLRAARRAGFGSREKDTIWTIAEPEAAAITALMKYTSLNAINAVKPGEHIMICDCGGGTVDITTYTVTQTTPELAFDELCAGTGGKCGSTYIDRNLHNLLSRRFGAAFDALPSSSKAPGSVFMNSFEIIKRSFGNSSNKGIREVHGLQMKIPSSVHYDQEESTILLTEDDVKALFDPVIGDIVNLIEQQIREAKIKEGAISSRIVLVGGFGESAYLNLKLTEWCASHGNILLVCPEKAQAAVVLGAAMRGLRSIAPKVKRARAYYGFGCSLPFREGVDKEDDRFISTINGLDYCEGRVSWEIKKGQAIITNTHTSTLMSVEDEPGESLTCMTKLYSTTRDGVETVDDDDLIGNITVIVPPTHNFGPALHWTYVASLNKRVCSVDLEIQVIFGNKGDNLTFKSLVNGKAIGSARIEFA